MTTGPEKDSEQKPPVPPTTLPATSPFGITVPVNVIPDRELGLSNPGAHSAAFTEPLPPGVNIDTDTGAHVMWAPPPPPPPTTPGMLIRAGALWGGLAILLVLAMVAGIGALNRDIYSASGFVQQYLSALARADSDAALSFPGVKPKATELAAAGFTTKLPDVLLRDSVLRAPKKSRIVSEDIKPDGVHVVTVEYVIDGEKARSSFEVERTGSQFGVFNEWRFAKSPLAILTVSVLHDALFTVNGLTLDTRAHHSPDAEPAFSNAASYLAFSPSNYVLSHESRLLSAPETPVPVTVPGVVTAATVDAQPTENFIIELQDEINRYLNECATQTVLQPTACPFGITIDDRVLSEPAWSIVEYPVVTLAATDINFEMPKTPGVAHISVEIQSIFDGDISMLESDEPFQMGLTVTIAPSGQLEIQLN